MAPQKTFNTKDTRAHREALEFILAYWMASCQKSHKLCHIKAGELVVIDRRGESR